ncbi:BTAD domain-containing putative transcriptional regulator [Nonomuraea sp. N2-4H]|uniref:AfsR/SARP family transcriptional regulator n=1 Tax=Nonomuraea sp. N2-4H TaxID=3128898 RepID=UPI00324CCEB7
MRVGILGPLRVAGSEVGGARVRALLVRLALDPGRVVTAERLIDDLWPGDPPAHPPAALQSLVSRARREAPGLIASHPAGYLLDVAPDEVDAWAFERLVRQGDVRRALALWRGAPLADAAALPFATGPAARLEELRLTALAARIAADLDLAASRTVSSSAARSTSSPPVATGPAAAPPVAPGPEELVAELEELVAAHPLREPFHALLVRALTAVGRRAEALAAFERIRNALAEELGVDPGPELREAHLAALQDQEPSPGRGPEPPGSNLPGPADEVRGAVGGHRQGRPAARHRPPGHARRPGWRGQDPPRHRDRLGDDRSFRLPRRPDDSASPAGRLGEQRPRGVRCGGKSVVVRARAGLDGGAGGGR